MSFERAEELPKEEILPEEPMSRQLLAVKNGIQRELIVSSITPNIDIENYPMVWIDTYDKKFREEFIQILKKHPEIESDWEDDSKKENIVAMFRRKLYLKLDD